MGTTLTAKDTRRAQLTGAAFGILLGIAVIFSQPTYGYWLATVVLPACPVEDSDNCYWDGSTRGNGDGDSFYVVTGTVTYK